MVQSPPFFLRTAGGTRAQLARNCTGTYKVEVMRVKLRELLGIPARSWMRQRVEVWLGITTDEAHRLNNHSRTPWLINRFPLTEKGLSREDCVQWLKAHGYAVPPKSACLGCPYRPDSDWSEMKIKRSGISRSVDRALRVGTTTSTLSLPSTWPLRCSLSNGNRLVGRGVQRDIAPLAAEGAICVMGGARSGQPPCTGRLGLTARPARPAAVSDGATSP
jgi:hypothetical protein